MLKNTGIQLTNDVKLFILEKCNTIKPYRIIDNKGRDTEYFTFIMEGKLVTLVCDAITKRILTCVIETHKKEKFKKIIYENNK